MEPIVTLIVFIVITSDSNSDSHNQAMFRVTHTLAGLASSVMRLSAGGPIPWLG